MKFTFWAASVEVTIRIAGNVSLSNVSGQYACEQ